ncbi:MAG: bifunctional diaminohydroxyphosphoribosylaminopyrimidine deaminase/5-amino-6-(5-phosphoribosylamino)uracil reductase RibD [Halioglobus sp.]
MFSDTDTRMMARALQQARKGRYWASPNPHVGCVLARNDTVIAEGFTQPAGGNHAEVQALEALKSASAKGATAYVTLEPCSHRGKTGPCAIALVEAGVSRVVVALEDPNPEVCGKGIQVLRSAGVAVEVGLLESEAAAIIPGFLKRMRKGRPYVRVKQAMSLDGRTAMASGESQWITGSAARQDVQRLRAGSCAVLTGIGTVLADNCSLTVRSEELGLTGQEAARAKVRAPLRVVLDSKGQTPVGANVLNAAAPTLLCIGKDADGSGLVGGNVEVHSLPAAVASDPDAGGLSLLAVMELLAQRQCNEILVESGARLTGALLNAGLVDELVVYMAPTLMGNLARPLAQLPLNAMAEKVDLAITDVRKVGQDWRFTATPS